ncbi:MAG: chemotaxis protein CheW [Magnetococcus sp. DMHC-8]
MAIHSEPKVVFSIHNQLYGVGVLDVDKIYRAMQVTALPDAPVWLMGLVNLGGHILPVVDMRNRLELPGKPIDPDDRLVRLTAPSACCFFVDRVLGVVAFDQDHVSESGDIHPQLDPHLAGVGRHDNATVLFITTAKLFSGVMAHTGMSQDEHGVLNGPGDARVAG